MFDGVFIASLIGACVGAIKETLEPTIPAENWANKELYYKDIATGVPIEQRIKNVKNGKYKLTEAHHNPNNEHVKYVKKRRYSLNYK